MNPHTVASLAVRLLVAAAAWLGCSAPVAAQPNAPLLPATAATEHSTPQVPHGEQATRDAQTEYPALHLSGFADINYAAQKASDGPRGFNEGQFVLHLAGALSPRVNFFGELSFTSRADAGTGSPPATGFNAEVERVIIRFDQSDALKVSFGRYHTPINWWNTAFHHGQWLQTTISRPEMVQFGGQFLPVHFVGALAEGVLPASGWNLGYQGGVGNGRGNVISRGGDAGDNNGRPAWMMNLFTKPDRVFGLQAGGSLYIDRVSIPGQPEFDERIIAAHAVWQREDPELIAEIADVRHERVDGLLTASSLAYYIQGAYRLPSVARQWKPYYRFEHIDIDRADPVFATVSNLDGSTLGVRFDISTYVAIKGELRVRRRLSDRPRTKGGFFQIAFTF
jgi:hypothetical protein